MSPRRLITAAALILVAASVALVIGAFTRPVETDCYARFASGDSRVLKLQRQLESEGYETTLSRGPDRPAGSNLAVRTGAELTSLLLLEHDDNGPALERRLEDALGNREGRKLNCLDRKWGDH
jgi:hypothetical protein